MKRAYLQQNRIICMKYNRIIISLFTVFVTLFLTESCTREIEFKDSLMEPKLVINGICALDSAVSLEISLSKATHGNLQEFSLIDDADVFLFVDGVKTEKLYHIENISGFYEGKTNIELDRKYAIEVEHSKFGKASADETAISNKVQILSTTIRIDSTNTDASARIPRIMSSIKFKDPANEENFYRLIVSCRVGKCLSHFDDTGNNTHVQVIDYYTLNERVESNDPVLMQSKTNDNMVFDESNSNYTLFSDQLFNGKEYELDFFLPNSMPYKLIQADTLKGGFYWIYVELQSLSKDVYLYIKSIDGADNITNGLFTEPYQVYSNIKNGIGIWGTYSSSIDTIKVGAYPIEGVEYTYNNAAL